MRLIITLLALFACLFHVTGQTSSKYMISRLTPEGKLYFIKPMTWQSDHLRVEADLTIHVQNDTDSMTIVCNMSLLHKDKGGLPNAVSLVGDPLLAADSISLLYVEQKRNRWHSRIQAEWTQPQAFSYLARPQLSIDYQPTSYTVILTGKQLKNWQSALAIISMETGKSQ